ncbi:MAG: collagen-like protein [Tissierellia bacterium]|nr:collagen-like protein [Tissierellia bacterium]
MTVTPQLNTLYIGVANTNINQVPAYNDPLFIWSKYVGEDGQPGDPGTPGAPGQDGETYYTWVKYAPNETPTAAEMSNYPANMRYLGLAFNQTTSDASTIYTDYQWSPLYDNVRVGGRNLFIKYQEEIDTYLNAAGVTIVDTTENYSTSNFIKIEPNENYVLSKTDSTVSSQHYFRYVWYTGDQNFISPRVSLTDNIQYLKSPANAEYIRLTYPKDVSVQLEYGNIKTSYRPSPEDIDYQISHGLNLVETEIGSLQDDLNNLSLDTERELGLIDQILGEYHDRLATLDNSSLSTSESLGALTGRTVAVENVLNGQAEKWTFLDSRIIKLGNEGIWIGEDDIQQNPDTGEWTYTNGILIGMSADGGNHIAFYNNNVRTAYIIDGTMHIDHGIFVESATIANFKFEKIQGTNVLSITYAG